MIAQVITGRLTYVDTEENLIQILDRADSQVTDLDIGEQTKLPASLGWERLVGEDVEAVVIDGKADNICLLA